MIAQRLARGVKTAKKDEPGHLKNHIGPLFGHLPVEDVASFRVIQEGFRVLEGKGISGSTLRNVQVTLRAVFKRAIEEGVIAHMPPPLTVLDGHLPAVDKGANVRPEGWRDEAVFTRDEIATLLDCPDIELPYRVMYATWFLTASRFAELVTARVHDYDRTQKPLAALTFRAVKTRRDRGVMFRVVPVHRELRPWLDWWLAEGYEMVHGVKPTPDAPLFPTFSVRRRNAGERLCSHGEVYKRWQRHHLPKAGLRHRRLHDSRRTFISLVRSSAKSKDIVRAVTHRSTKDRVLDAYTTWEWEALCGELSRVKWNLPLPPGREQGVVVLSDRRGGA